MKESKGELSLHLQQDVKQLQQDLENAYEKGYYDRKQEDLDKIAKQQQTIKELLQGLESIRAINNGRDMEGVQFFTTTGNIANELLNKYKQP